MSGVTDVVRARLLDKMGQATASAIESLCNNEVPADVADRLVIGVLINVISTTLSGLFAEGPERDQMTDITCAAIRKFAYDIADEPTTGIVN